MLHGLNAYNKVEGIHALIRRVQTAVSGAEICTSNAAIGNIGISVSGDIRCGFSRDCWSTVENGCRVHGAGDGMSEDEYRLMIATEHLGGEMIRYGHFAREFAVKFPGAAVAETIACHKIQKSAYAEFWEKVDGDLDYFWVKKSATQKEKAMARVLARHFGKFLLEVRADFNINAEYPFEEEME